MADERIPRLPSENADRFDGNRSELDAVLTGIGSVIRDYVAKELDPLRARVKELEARPQAHDAGAWRSGARYQEGAIVSYQGSGWICSVAHQATGEFDHYAFRLLSKRGKDGRDGKDAK